jgi:MoxR-like ATPase
MKQKIETLLNQLNHGLVERENTVKIALLAVLAGENLVLVGPPGTGKSLIARRIADSLEHDGNGHFEYLLTKFSTPEEIFGPLSLTELKADRFRRNTAGYLPAVKVAFLDEIFKASSSILNALLTILNERIFHNGSEAQKVPLQSLIAASNELLGGQEELDALYDRFLIRSFVDYVSQDNLPRLFEKTGEMPQADRLTDPDMESIRNAAASVDIPPEIGEAIRSIWVRHREMFREDRRESLSDRRLKKVIGLLCVSAATNGRSEADLSDVFLLKDCLWNHQENALAVRQLVMETLRGFSRPVPRDAVVADASGSRDTAGSGTGSVVRGFRGSGTSDDPLLVETVEELMDLGRPEVGLQGYHFRQTADIDCSGLSSWTNITFKGYYDGGGHLVRQDGIRPLDNTGAGTGAFFLPIAAVIANAATTASWPNLFACIEAGSSVMNLRLENLKLAASVVMSQVTRCMSNVSLIGHNVTGSTLSACQSGYFMIQGEAVRSTVSDCVAAISLDWDTRSDFHSLGGIARTLREGSVVERCFATGSLRNRDNGDIFLSGIADCCDGSAIRNCATGRFSLDGSFVRLKHRIVADLRDTSVLSNNAAIDSNSGSDDINGRDGKTVAAALFKQRFMEHTLDWDFGRIWEWDHRNDRPALRWAGAGTAVPRAAGMADLLEQQLRANIWV